MSLDLNEINARLREQTPRHIVEWALQQGQRPVVTTNFGPYEATILHACSQVAPQLNVIWCDSGYNTLATYKHAETLMDQLSLNVFAYVPKQSAAHRDAKMEGIPDVSDPLHELFTEQVKMEPFRRALAEHQPDVWFTNLRKDQTAFRGGLDIVTKGNDGILKVSPFFYWSESELDVYIEENNLSNERNYYDPTKVLENRECGLHTGKLT